MFLRFLETSARTNTRNWLWYCFSSRSDSRLRRIVFGQAIFIIIDEGALICNNFFRVVLYSFFVRSTLNYNRVQVLKNAHADINLHALVIMKINKSNCLQMDLHIFLYYHLGLIFLHCTADKEVTNVSNLKRICYIKRA